MLHQYFCLSTIEENFNVTSEQEILQVTVCVALCCCMIMEMVQQGIVDSISNILSVENNAGWTELQKVTLCLHTTGRNVLLV